MYQRKFTLHYCPNCVTGVNNGCKVFATLIRDPATRNRWLCRRCGQPYYWAERK